MATKTKHANPVKARNPFAYGLATRTGSGAGKHHNRTKDVAKGRSRKVKHKGRKDW